MNLLSASLNQQNKNKQKIKEDNFLVTEFEFLLLSPNFKQINLEYL